MCAFDAVETDDVTRVAWAGNPALNLLRRVLEENDRLTFVNPFVLVNDYFDSFVLLPTDEAELVFRMGLVGTSLVEHHLVMP
jgi:hypothetical protein